MIDRLRSWLRLPRRETHAQRVADLQKRSDVVLVRARRAQKQAERDRLANAVNHTVRAVRRERAP